jgi:hypothetical protein
MNTFPSYKDALLYSIKKEEYKNLVIQSINKADSRKTREDDECPTWVFCEIINPLFQMQSKNCIICGKYIKIGWYVDPERKIKHIYCNDLKHQHTTNALVNLIWVKQLLKIYYIKKEHRFLYYAALECILHLKPELHTLAYVFREYIGIPHNVW